MPRPDLTNGFHGAGLWAKWSFSDEAMADDTQRGQSMTLAMENARSLPPK